MPQNVREGQYADGRGRCGNGSAAVVEAEGEAGRPSVKATLGDLGGRPVALRDLVVQFLVGVDSGRITLAAMTETWDPRAPGVLRLPSGRKVRGRGVRYPVPEGPEPGLGVYLLGRTPPEVAWEARWVRWPDFWLPSDRRALGEALREAWERAEGERVEFACGGGHGRTGTALACLAVVDGVPAGEAVAYVRAHYNRRAVETPWQRRFVGRFQP